MKEIAGHIRRGALAFLHGEYRVLGAFVLVAGGLLGFVSLHVETTHFFIVPAFFIGALFSATAGNIGMRVATHANVRTAQAARLSLSKAFRVAFTGGKIMGLCVGGMAVFGLSFLFILLFSHFMSSTWTTHYDMTIVLEALAGFSLGAEFTALFARLGGGIYTKAADVGADLVGKLEAGIPEDDPRNPATIADNVGDNVGDVAGMGADLFGSYVATILAAMVLGSYLIRDLGDAAPDVLQGIGPIVFPLVIGGLGILFSALCASMVRVTGENPSEKDIQRSLNIANWAAIGLVGVSCWFLVHQFLPARMPMDFLDAGVTIVTPLRVFYAILVGLTVGGLISWLTEYFTIVGNPPVMRIIRSSVTGGATNILSGLSVGMASSFGPVLLFGMAIWAAYSLAGFYGVAIAASSMMATISMQLAIDGFGPIADNAGGIAEMCEMPPEVRSRTDVLDAAGNTTAAIGKGFAIASAALTALALLAAYVALTGIDGINIFKAKVLASLLIGVMVPVVFSSLAIRSVGTAAMAMVLEVRRQFRELPGIMKGHDSPDYERCIRISTQASLREMLLPGLLAVVLPVLVGFLVGAEALGAYMAGVTVSGVVWAIFQNNAGGAWDNAKKSIESGVTIDGKSYGKGSDPHKAAITGDMVGDPFKDTSGPSMNILIKLSSLIGLVMAPILAEMSIPEQIHLGDPVQQGAMQSDDAAYESDLSGTLLIPPDEGAVLNLSSPQGVTSPLPSGSPTPGDPEPQKMPVP